MRRAAAVVGLLCGALGLLLYLVRERRPTAPPPAAPRVATSVHPIWLPRPRPISWWIGQLHLGARRIAGRVTFDGQPVPGAAVRLTSDEMAVGDWTLIALAADGAGRFDLGPVRAGRYHVRAEAPGRLAGDVIVDLRAPDPVPVPDALEVALGPCALRVHGSVRNARGGAVAGAHVRATRSWFIYLAHADADAAGSYEACVPSGNVHLEATAPGYGAETLHRTGLRDLRVDFVLRPEVVIAGVVLGADGTPVDGAEVRAETDGHLPGAVTESDSDGRFRIEGLSSEQHYVVVARAEEMAAEKPVWVSTPGKTLEIELRLGKRATFRGRVVESGRPVGDATVLVEETEFGRMLGTAVAQADGRFELSGLPRTRVHLRLRGWRLLTPKVVDLAGPEGGPVELACERLASVSGTVQSGGRPVARAAVTLEPVDTMRRGRAESRHETTLVDGTFRIAGIEPGPFELRIRSEEGLGFANRALEIQSQDVTGLRIELDRGGSISGTVVSTDGEPVTDATVNVFRGGQDGGYSSTGPDGAFRIPSLVGGQDYHIMLTAAADPTLRSTPQGTFPDVHLGEGADITGLRLVVQAGGLPISGHAFQAGRPAVGIEVQALGGPEAHALTDTEGAFTVNGLPPGKYPLFFRLHGKELKNVAGVEAGTTDYRVDLPSTGSIEGTLVGFHEKPQIALDPNPWMAVDVAGEAFVVGDLLAGTYQVMATGPTGEGALAKVTVSDDAATPVTLTASVAHVEGILTRWPGGEPIAGATCDWHFFEPIWRGKAEPAMTDGAGRFTMNVPPGKGGASCRLAGQGTTVHAVIVDVAPGATTQVDVSIFLGDRRSNADGLYFDGTNAVKIADGAYAAAGLEVGDHIVSIDGHSLVGLSSGVVNAFLVNHDPGTPVLIIFERGGVEQSLQVTLGPPVPGHL